MTLFGIVIDVRDVQSKNARFPIVVPLVIITSFSLLFLIYEIANEGIVADSIWQL